MNARRLIPTTPNWSSLSGRTTGEAIVPIKKLSQPKLPRMRRSSYATAVGPAWAERPRGTPSAAIPGKSPADVQGISPGLAWVKTLAAASGLVFNAHIMPGPRNPGCDARHSQSNAQGSATLRTGAVIAGMVRGSSPVLACARTVSGMVGFFAPMSAL